MIFEGDRLVTASPAATWKLIADPAKVLSFMPGVTEVTMLTSERYSAHCVFPLGLGDLHLDTELRLVDSTPRQSARLFGAAHGDGVHVSFDIKIRLEAGSEPDTTSLGWNASIVIRGPIVGMSQHVTRYLVSQQIDAAHEALVTKMNAV